MAEPDRSLLRGIERGDSRALESLEGEEQLPAGEECDPARLSERAELARRVRRALAALPEPERRALLLKLYGELRYHEIAGATGEPVGTVKWRIARAYARLRTLLMPHTDPAEEGNERVPSTAAVPARRDEAAGPLADAASPAPLPRVLPATGR